MSRMEHSTVSPQAAAEPRRTHAAADTNERDVPHFRSLRVPGLVSGPLLATWLRKPFRRKAIHS
jgi:hypothetical protein